jgi:hypothetical protein
MADNVSDRLVAALERLHQAIERLDEHVTDHLDREQAKTASPLVAERLDRIIKRIELALTE